MAMTLALVSLVAHLGGAPADKERWSVDGGGTQVMAEEEPGRTTGDGWTPERIRTPRTQADRPAPSFLAEGFVPAILRAHRAEPAPPAERTPERTVWDDLADCESGNWIDGGRSFEEGSARWAWGKPGTELPPWGTTIHDGGLQFHPDTWDAFRPAGFPERAYDATREQQIHVAEKVQEHQGWGAWPVCSEKLGLR